MQFNLSPTQIEKLTSCTRIIFVSCGTSYHASIYAKYLLEEYANIPVDAEYASEFRYRTAILDSKTLVVGISQSGETADTLAALRLAKESGAITMGLINVANSSVARLVEIGLCSYCGPEIAVASTKVYTAQLLILYYFSLYMAELRNKLEPSQISEKVQDSQKLATLADSLLTNTEQIAEFGRTYAGYQHMLYLGRGLFYPLALEGALKLKELSYIHAEGYAAAEMKHGPIALIDSRMPVVVLAPQHGQLYEKMQSNIAEIKARGGRLLAFTQLSDGGKEQVSEYMNLYNDFVILPKLNRELDHLLFAIPLQLFAYYIAITKAINPDQPRNLAKSVTVE